jgi:hypothetical protein
MKWQSIMSTQARQHTIYSRIDGVGNKRIGRAEVG